MSHMYFDTFIAVADDCAAEVAKVPVPRGTKKTVAEVQFAMLDGQPFVHTMEDILFRSWFDRRDDIDPADLAEDELQAMRAEYFSTGRACLRASPLTKTHGWGVVFDSDGRAALVARESDDYAHYLNDPNLTVVKAMRSKRA